MKNNLHLFLRGLLAAFATTLATGAWADNADLDVPGPTGRSWVRLDADVFTSRGDSELASTGTRLSSQRSTSRFGTLYGSLALHERVSVLFDVQRSLFRSTYEPVGGPSSVSTSSGNSGMIGADLRPIGSPTGQGFGLVAQAMALHVEGGNDAYMLALQPQYRFTDSLLGLLHLGTVRSSGTQSNYFTDVGLVWKITPDMSLKPSIGWQRYKPGDGYPAMRELGASVEYSYHFSRHFSALTRVGLDRQADWEYLGTRSVNNRGSSFSIGLRWAL